MKSVLMMTIGAISLLIGLVFLPLPPPFFGIVFIAIGLPLMAAGSKRVRRIIQYLRWRLDHHDLKIEQAVHRLPRLIRFMAIRTRPAAMRRYRLRQMRKNG